MKEQILSYTEDIEVSPALRFQNVDTHTRSHGDIQMKHTHVHRHNADTQTLLTHDTDTQTVTTH